MVTWRFVAAFGRMEIKFSSCASQSMVLSNKSQLLACVAAWFEAKSESPITTSRAPFMSSRLAATPSDSGPIWSVFASNFTSGSILGVVKLRAEVFRISVPSGSDFDLSAMLTVRASGKNVMCLVKSLVMGLAP